MKYTFRELIDVPKLQELADELYTATSISSAIIAMDGEILTGSGWQKICADFHRKHPQIEKECIESDTNIRTKLAEGEPFVIYKCPRGLVDASSPIIIAGEHVANVFSGQVFLEPPDETTERFFREQARKFGFDETEYMKAFKEVPIFAEKKFRAGLSFLAKLAQTIADNGLTRLKELEAMESVLRSTERFHRLFEQASDAFFIHNFSNGKIVDANESALKNLGYTRDELLELNVSDIEVSQTPEAIVKVSSRVEKVRPVTVEGMHRRKNGSIFPVETSLGMLQDEDPALLLAIARDTTEHKRAEESLKKAHDELERRVEERTAEVQKANENLRRSERRNRSWLEHSPACTKIVDAGFNLQYMSTAGVKGLQIDDITQHYGKPYPCCFFPELFKIQMTNDMRKAKEEGIVIEQEASVFDMAGNEVWYHSTIVPVNDEEGRFEYFLIVSIDTTERKQAEEALRKAHDELETRVEERTAALFEANKALRESEEKFRSLIENIPGVSYRCRCDENRTMEFISDEVKILTGYPASDFLQNAVRSWASIMHPESKEASDEYVMEKINRKEPYTTEYGIIGADGDIRWCYERGQGVFDEQGKVRFLDGVIVDHTDRKQAEEALRIEKDNLRNIFESIEDGIYIVNRQFDIRYVNPLLVKDFGPYQGRKCYEYFHDRDEICPWCKNQDVLTGKTVRWEWYSIKNGRTYDLIDTPMTLQDGSIGKLEIFRDITHIKHNLKEKEVLLSEIHHRVKNNMQVISSLLKLQSAKIEDKKYVDMFKDSENRIRSMALVHEKLYQSKDFSSIDFKGYVKSIANHLIRSYAVNPDKIRLNTEIEDIPLGIDNGIPCGLIINELISNSLKYAFPKDREGEINIVLRAINSHEIELTVSDDGIGIPAEIDIRETESLGLQLVHILAENQLEGSVELDRDKGTAFRIRFKN